MGILIFAKVCIPKLCATPCTRIWIIIPNPSRNSGLNHKSVSKIVGFQSYLVLRLYHFSLTIYQGNWVNWRINIETTLNLIVQAMSMMNWSMLSLIIIKFSLSNYWFSFLVFCFRRNESTQTSPQCVNLLILCIGQWPGNNFKDMRHTQDRSCFQHNKNLPQIEYSPTCH